MGVVCTPDRATVVVMQQLMPWARPESWEAETVGWPGGPQYHSFTEPVAGAHMRGTLVDAARAMNTKTVRRRTAGPRLVMYLIHSRCKTVFEP